MTAIGNAHALRHGHAARIGGVSPTYITWANMVGRCAAHRASWLSPYALQGITVCDRWLKFENFLADMGERPEGTSIDRFPNGSGNYEPGNCRWATPTMQSRN